MSNVFMNEMIEPVIGCVVSINMYKTPLSMEWNSNRPRLVMEVGCKKNKPTYQLYRAMDEGKSLVGPLDIVTRSRWRVVFEGYDGDSLFKLSLNYTKYPYTTVKWKRGKSKRTLYI